MGKGRMIQRMGTKTHRREEKETHRTEGKVPDSHSREAGQSPNQQANITYWDGFQN